MTHICDCILAARNDHKVRIAKFMRLFDIPHSDAFKFIEDLKIREIAEQLNMNESTVKNYLYKGKEIIVISVLKGSIMFMADLLRSIDTHVEIDFMVVSSYGSGVVSTGAVKMLKDIFLSIEGKDVLIVEDILDTGKTLHYIKEYLGARKPSSIKICTLLDKPERREADVPIKYKGFEVDNLFIVGYGLDYDQKYRNLPYISFLNE